MGVVIGETARVGADVTIYHGVTLGGTSLDHGKRHPTIGDRVTVGAGAKVLGNLDVGDDSRIGANAVLVRSVDDHSVVVGVPGQVIAHATAPGPDTRPKQDSPTAPDPLALAISTLMLRVSQLESRVVDEHGADGTPPRSTVGPTRRETGSGSSSSTRSTSRSDRPPQAPPASPAFRDVQHDTPVRIGVSC